jgi:hypothetical protein
MRSRRESFSTATAVRNSYQFDVAANRSNRDHIPQVDFKGPIVRLETAKGCHKVFDLAGRRGFAGFEVALDAQSGEERQHHLRDCGRSYLRPLGLDVHGEKAQQ